MDKFIIPENERKPEKFPDIRSQKRKEKKKKKKKSAFAKSLTGRRQKIIHKSYLRGQVWITDKKRQKKECKYL